MMKHQASTPRALALSLLLRCEHDRLFSNLVLDTALKRNPLSDADRGFLTALFYGVLERRLTLDHLISCLSDRAPEDLDDEVRVLLRLGLYQLCYMDRVPAHAALYETVELAPKKSRGFVNALLRRYTREADTLPFPSKETDRISYLSVTYSYPAPLCERLLAVFGEERTERLLAVLDRTPPLTLRVNTLHTSREALIERLIAFGAEVLPSAHAPHAIRLAGGNPTALPGFADGDFFVQDEASQLCVQAIDARPGMTVLDICACPGSKTFGMALNMQNMGKLFAYDLHENKLSLIQKGAERLGITCISTAARDGRVFDPALERQADRVLCDVPCSGFGVLAKKPEIRYKDLSELAPLPDIQLAILENASRYVAPGGVLLYSTCTILPEENEHNVTRFLSTHPEFSLVSFEVGDLSAPSGMLTLTPDEHGTDGFFMAKLTLTEKKE